VYNIVAFLNYFVNQFQILKVFDPTTVIVIIIIVKFLYRISFSVVKYKIYVHCFPESPVKIKVMGKYKNKYYEVN
jgi:phage shock protein PspC (stress-responsive transcriptional regulator)